MIYGVERSTDMRSPQTVIRRFTSTRAAQKWKAGGGGFTHSDPKAARNYHHTFRYVYEVSGRPPSVKAMQKQAYQDSTPTYPRSAEDVLAGWIYENSEEL